METSRRFAAHVGKLRVVIGRTIGKFGTLIFLMLKELLLAREKNHLNLGALIGGRSYIMKLHLRTSYYNTKGFIDTVVSL